MKDRIFVILLALFLAAAPSPGSTPAVKIKVVGDMEFVFIHGGSFAMGSLENEGSEDEHPRHPVDLHSFWLGRHEVSQEQYEKITGKNPSRFRGVKRPVENISWNDAREFTIKFSSMHGIAARLPYEAEWEYAAKAGTHTRYYWGDGMVGNYAWYNGNSGGGTRENGLKNPNQWGIHDISGNVWEWCMDWYDENYYKYSPLKNPAGPASGSFRVIRGGGWDLNSSFLRHSLRDRNHPGNRNSVLGFRIVLEDQ